jgi:hypothetical protein
VPTTSRQPLQLDRPRRSSFQTDSAHSKQLQLIHSHQVPSCNVLLFHAVCRTQRPALVGLKAGTCSEQQTDLIPLYLPM